MSVTPRFPKRRFLVIVTLALVWSIASPRLHPPAAASIGVRDELPTDQLIVKYKASADLSGANAPAHANRMLALSAAAGVRLEYFREMSGDAHVLRLPQPWPVSQVQIVADRLMTLADVEYAEPDRILQHTLIPNDPSYASQWHYSETYGINARPGGTSRPDRAASSSQSSTPASPITPT